MWKSKMRTLNYVYWSRPDTDRGTRSFSLVALSAYREMELIPVWSHPLVGGRGVDIRPSTGSPLVLRLNYRHPIGPTHPSDLSVSLRAAGSCRSQTPSIFLSGLVRRHSSSSNKRRRFSIARNLGHSFIGTHRPIANETNWLRERLVVRRTFGDIMVMMQSSRLKHYTEQNKFLHWILLLFAKRG